MSQNVLYLDPWSGISGDMALSALLDLGGAAAEAALQAAVRSMDLNGVAVEVERTAEWGLACTRIKVLDEDAPPLRHLEQMLEVIDRAALSARVKGQARAAVTRLAEVEAGVHGCEVDHIHFHEVGAADTLVDVVGAFVLVEALGIDRVHVGTIPVGGGTVQIAHGRMGVPAPATAALLAGYVSVGGPEMRELTTPTGALLVGQLAATQGPLPAMTVRAVGYGAGTMKLEHGPNVLRAVLGEAAREAGATPDAPGAAGGDSGGGAGPEPHSDTVVELQTNIDDVSPEIIGYAARRLREAGALDVWTVPAQMKKDRPGVVLHVLVAPHKEAAAVGIIFAETGTLGVRRAVLQRYVAGRGCLTVAAGGADVAVKWGAWGDTVNLAPEFEDAARAAAAAGVPLRQVTQEAAEKARVHLAEGGAA
jgi:pyridinium-3,5-bisthiocarboxylic acid mononucleotide nickel chelatase